MAVESFLSGAELRVVSGPVGDHEEHWDPKSTGNPLLDASDRDVSLSPNFSVGELTASGPERFDVARIDPDFVVCLQAVRDLVGGAVVVTSGYRSWGYNEKIYARRAKTPTLSRHCSGQAADIRIAGMSGMEIVKAAIKAYGGNIGVGIGANFAHVDVRGRWARWSYLGGEDNRRAIQEISAYRRSRKNSSPPHPPHTGGVADRSVPEIDVARAVRRNLIHAARLGWASRQEEVVLTVGIDDPAPTAEEFAEAVAVWQAEVGLEVDGIVGPKTWARILELADVSDVDATL